MINKIITLQQPAVVEKSLVLSSDICVECPVVLIGDEYRLFRILINLVSNAIKFTKKGFVKLRVELERTVETRKCVLKFIVQDSGIGIPDNKIDYIYERFSPLEPSNKNHFKGLGLGLTIVKKFIEDLDGEIEVKSKINIGTTISCALPFKLSIVS